MALGTCRSLTLGIHSRHLWNLKIAVNHIKFWGLQILPEGMTIRNARYQLRVWWTGTTSLNCFSYNPSPLKWSEIHTCKLPLSQDWPILWEVKLKLVFLPPPLKHANCICLVLEIPSTGYCFGLKHFCIQDFLQDENILGRDNISGCHGLY